MMFRTTALKIVAFATMLIRIPAAHAGPCEDLQGILNSSCTGMCHVTGANAPQNMTIASLTTNVGGPQSKKYLTLGNPAQSYIWDRVAANEMPDGMPFSQSQKDAMKKAIELCQTTPPASPGGNTPSDPPPTPPTPPGESHMFGCVVQSGTSANPTTVEDKGWKVIKQYCAKCHTDAAKGDFRTFEAFKSSGKVSPGNAAGSRVIIRIEEGTMPPAPVNQNPKPSPAEVQDLKTWIQQGLKPPTPEGHKIPKILGGKPMLIDEVTLINSVYFDLYDESGGLRTGAGRTGELKDQRYFSLHNFYNDPSVSCDKMEELRGTIAKAVNSLSFGKDKAEIRPVDTLIIRPPWVVPGDPSKSPLYHSVSREIAPMPKNNNLTEAEQQELANSIKAWIEQGFLDPRVVANSNNTVAQKGFQILESKCQGCHGEGKENGGLTNILDLAGLTSKYHKIPGVLFRVDMGQTHVGRLIGGPPAKDLWKGIVDEEYPYSLNVKRTPSQQAQQQGIQNLTMLQLINYQLGLPTISQKKRDELLQLKHRIDTLYGALYTYIPAARIDWFSSSFTGKYYYKWMGFAYPEYPSWSTAAEIEKNYIGVSPVSNFLTCGGNLRRMGVQISNVILNNMNRVVDRHTTYSRKYYWLSYDFRKADDDAIILASNGGLLPKALGPSEWWVTPSQNQLQFAVPMERAWVHHIQTNVPPNYDLFFTFTRPHEGAANFGGIQGRTWYKNPVQNYANWFILFNDVDAARQFKPLKSLATYFAVQPEQRYNKPIGLDLAFVHDAGEMLFELPNGFIAYFLAVANALTQSEVPDTVASTNTREELKLDRNAVVNAYTCMGCHPLGVKTFTDTLASAVRQKFDAQIARNDAITQPTVFQDNAWMQFSKLQAHLGQKKVNEIWVENAAEAKTLIDAGQLRVFNAIEEVATPLVRQSLLDKWDPRKGGADNISAEPIINTFREYYKGVNSLRLAQEVGALSLEAIGYQNGRDLNTAPLDRSEIEKKGTVFNGDMRNALEAAFRALRLEE